MSYDVVLTDPPWQYYGQTQKWGAAEKFYRCLPFDEIAAIEPPLNKPGVLFMWTTSAMMEQALALLPRWGLAYRGIAFVWVKTSKAGKPFGARGVRPSITKPLTEFVVAASNIAKGRPLAIASESVQQTVFAPLREHSRKPDEVYAGIEALYPAASKLEMYARSTRNGWAAHGDELPNKDPC